MEHCLPSIYLMDALIKNIGAPYKDIFKPKLCHIFVTTYHRVNQPLRSKLCRLLGTWPQIYGDEHVAEICYAVQNINFPPSSVPDLSRRALDLVTQSRSNGTAKPVTVCTIIIIIIIILSIFIK